MTYNVEAIRTQFPALHKRPAVYFDNPAGTQVARRSADRMLDYLLYHNSNHGGAFSLSQESDNLLNEARAAAATFLNVARPEEVVFGPNMTSLTLHLSRSLAHLLEPGDHVVVTRLDHDANISPWTLAAEERGATVAWVDFDVEDGTLKLDTLHAALEKRPKIVAVGYASNALGTINPVAQITREAQAAGALVFIDAVQYAPHGVIDVQALGCDFLACSAYKFYGPHMGLLYGKHEHLETLKAYKVRPASNQPPGKWETGTGNHEGIMGVYGALEHFAMVGEEHGAGGADLRAKLVSGMNAVHTHENTLGLALLEMLNSIPKVRIYGLNDRERIGERVPTFSINVEGHAPLAVAQRLNEHDIFVWHGNYYALAVTERLGLEDSGGMVRIGAAHYNTLEDVEKLGTVLKSF